MKRLILIAVLFACEGPEGPMGLIGPGGDTDTLYVYTSDTTYVIDTVFVLHVDGREIVWLYPDSASAVPGSYYPCNPGEATLYFDINWEEFMARRPTTIWVLPKKDLFQFYSQWQSWGSLTPSSHGNIFYGKLGLRNDYDTEWLYAYFYWDTE